jgi:hypothetical protein
MGAGAQIWYELDLAFNSMLRLLLEDMVKYVGVRGMTKIERPNLDVH